jgi:hypothetical protein
MKTLLSSKALVVVLFSVVLAACGGSSNDDDDNNSSSSVVASSEAVSSVASSSAPSAALVIYEEDILDNWMAWDCCGQSTPVALVASEVEHGKAVRFEINGATVVGFSSRAGHNAVDGAVFDATDIKTTGIISFDLKMITAPTDGVGVWKFKVESYGGQAPAGSAAEVNLSSSHEGHVAPVLNTWQTYTFDLADLETAGVNLAGLDVFMVFPAWNTGDGAEFEIDNMRIWSTGATP